MDLVLQLFVCAVCLIFLAVFIIYLLPRYKRWRKKTTQLSNIAMRLEELGKLRNEIMFHLGWAIERGEPTEDYHYDIRKIDEEIAQLSNESDSIELSDMIKV